MDRVNGLIRVLYLGSVEDVDTWAKSLGHEDGDAMFAESDETPEQQIGYYVEQGKVLNTAIDVEEVYAVDILVSWWSDTHESIMYNSGDGMLYKDQAGQLYIKHEEFKNAILDAE